jgi:hypothetical protein
LPKACRGGEAYHTPPTTSTPPRITSRVIAPEIALALQHLHHSHALPALIRKFHEAKIQNKPAVEIWGSDKPRREFLYLDDLADAGVYLMENYAGKDIGILANI